MPHKVEIICDDALVGCQVSGPSLPTGGFHKGLIYAMLGLAADAVRDFKPALVATAPAGALKMLPKNGAGPDGLVKP